MKNVVFFISACVEFVQNVFQLEIKNKSHAKKESIKITELKNMDNLLKGTKMKSIKILYVLIFDLILIGALISVSINVNPLYAQTSQDVVYLKNGSIIKGNIIEQIIGQNIKLETRDGNLFVFKMDEIEKIGKDNSSKQINTNQGSIEVNQPVEMSSRTRIGVSVGSFSIDLNDFDQIYGSSSGLCYGINLDWGISSMYSSVFRFKYFSKSGKPVGTGILDGSADWKEYLLFLGGRFNIRTNSSVIPYIGGGVTYVSVNEELSATLYNPYSSSYYTTDVSYSFNKGSVGFTFMGGLSVGLSDKVFLDADMEYTVASVKGEGGVGGEDCKVGGIFYGIGLHFGL